LTRVRVGMSDDFYEALSGFAVEHDILVADVLRWGAKALLSKSHRWDSKVYGRPRAQCAKVGLERGADSPL